MKTILLLITGVIFLSAHAAFSQNAHFTTSGTIEYEKKVNMFALIKKIVDQNKDDSFLQQIYDEYRKNKPQFKNLKSTLSFSGNKTRFEPKEDEEPAGIFSNNAMVDQNNSIYTDLSTTTYIDQKSVFESTFLIKDSTRKINWKITDETKEIAGYMCRRANAIILDSIYVVAFYTERIPVSGGPESFTGLPGMILGLALPHENISWFATRVTEGFVDDKNMLPPKKGKPATSKDLRKTLDGFVKDWGSWGNTFLKAFSI